MAKQNPLFVVTDNGKTVEEADHIFDAIIKKLGLEEFIVVLKGILKSLIELIEQTNSLVMLEHISKILDKFIANLDYVIKKIDPVLAFSLFKR